MSARMSALLFGMVLGCFALFLFLANQIKKSPTTDPDVTPSVTPATYASTESPKRTDAKVKLAVLVVFDQMRGDYVERWRPLFGNGGFKRIQEEGTWFSNCMYPYGLTSTGPGHASMMTGCSADRHGITNNEWFDRETGTEAYCAGSDRYDYVPAKPPAKTRPTKVGTPDRLMAESLADVLKAASPQSKVFGLSLKDRSAIFPVGHKPDGAYWFDSGKFVTSTYYRDALHPWVAEFNRGKSVDRWFDTPWTKFRPELDYTQHSGPDEVPGEAKLVGRGTTFPHTMTGGKKELAKEYYDAVVNSPFGNDLLLELAKECVIAEKLGQRDVPDLLTVSFSSNDIIGHTYGPDSQEVLDVTLRSDAQMDDLLKFLDRTVGEGQYVLVVCSDHGICPLPELSAALGRDAQRLSAVTLLLQGERHLQSKFGKLDGNFETKEAAKRTTWIETVEAPWLYINERLCKSRGLKKEDVAAEYANWLRTVPGIQAVYTAEQLQKPDSLDSIGKIMAKSYSPGRSGDLGIVLKPYYLIDAKAGSAGTNHGTPHDYDRHVPLMVFGPGVNPGVSREAVQPQHCAPILAQFLGIAPPKQAEAVLPETLLKPAVSPGKPDR